MGLNGFKKTLFAALLWTVPWSLEAADSAGPKAYLPENSVEFGKIAHSTSAIHEFQIVNQGSAPLQIQDISSDCSCTTALTGSQTLGPGDKSFIRVNFSSLGLSGPFKKNVMVKTSDPENPMIVLTVSGVIERGIVVVPTALDFGTVREGKRVQKEILVRYPAFKRQGIRTVERPKELDIMILNDSSTSPPGERIQVALKTNIPKGILSRTLTVHFNNPEEPPVRVPVNVIVTGAIEAEPSFIAMTVQKDAPLPEQKIQVSSSTSDPFQIEKMEYDEKLFEVNLEPSTVPGLRYHISIKLKAVPELKSIATHLTLITSSPKQPKIIIPIQIVNQKS